jgi:hypothetical protein
MADDPVAAPSGADPTNPPAGGDPAAPAAPADLDTALKELAKWQAMSRKNEARAKENADAATELQAIKDAQLSAEQKAQKLADKAAAEAADAKAQLARYQVATAKGVPVELLTGTDEATLLTQADALLAFAGRQPAAPSAPDLGQGNRGAVSVPQDPNAWLRRMAGGQ